MNEALDRELVVAELCDLGQRSVSDLVSCLQSWG